MKQRFRSEKHNFFTEEINKTAISLNNDKIIQSIDSIKSSSMYSRSSM